MKEKVWVSVKDRLPRCGQRVFIDYTYRGKAEVRFDKNGNYLLYDDLGDYTITKSA